MSATWNQIVIAAGSLLLLLGAPTPVGAQVSPADLEIHVEQELWLQLQQDESAGYAIYFHERADLAPAFGMSWEQRGRFVVEALQEAAKVAQAQVIDHLTRSGARFKSYWVDNVVVVEGSDFPTFTGLLAFPEIETIRELPDIHLIDPVERLPPDGPTTSAIEPNLHHVNAPDVWAMGITGSGLVVGVIDGGPRHTHQALVNQYRGHLGGGVFDHQYNWWDPGNGNAVPTWEDHGTHVAGIIAGDDGGANQIGIAPGADWIACEMFPCATLACALECGQFMLAPWDGSGANPDPDRRPHVVNNSWGLCGNALNTFFLGTTDSWRAAGIVPVFANGNSGAPCFQPALTCNQVINPARYGSVLGVGATGTANAQPASFSLWGPTNDPNTINPLGHPNLKPNVSAPGTSIRSSVAGGDAAYQAFSGTSMASPHVAGMVALLWQAAPCLIGDYALTGEILMTHSTPIPHATSCGGEGPGNVPNHFTGWGEIDALAIVLAGQALCGDPGTIEGLVTRTDTGTPIEGALVRAVGPVTLSAATEADGSYQITAFPGTYDVTASKTGFASATEAGAEVEENETATVDLALDPAPIAAVSPGSFSFEVDEGGSDGDVLSIGNLGEADLHWSIATGAPGSLAGSLSHDPGLDEAFELPAFDLVPLPSGGGPVVFTVPGGGLSRGDVAGFSFAGTASGITGQSSWASDTCLVVTAPDGRSFGVGGFGTATIPGCGVQNPWGFQGGGSANDGTYASSHDDVFDPTASDLGEWTFTFINDWDSASAATISWSDVTVTLHKAQLPVCEDLTEIPWLSADPSSGTTAAGTATPVAVAVDAAGLVGGIYVAGLCVSTDDPDAALVPVVVTLTVVAEAPVADVSPASFAFEVPLGEVAGDVLDVGNTGTADLLWSIATAETAAGCASPVEVPWLAAAPNAGTTPPDGSVPVDVVVDTTTLALGTFEAALCVSTNDTARPLVAVPVTLTVGPPASFGTLEGTVRSASACDASFSAPLPGATVLIAGQLDDYELTTDENGFYQLLLDEAESPMEVTVTAPGHFAGVATGVVVDGGEVTVQDFDLVQDAPCIEVAPESLSATLELGQGEVQALEIRNLGSQLLEWLIQLDGASLGRNAAASGARTARAFRSSGSSSGPSSDPSSSQAQDLAAASGGEAAPSAADEAAGIDPSPPTAGPGAPAIQGIARQNLLRDGVLLIAQSVNSRIMAFDPATGDLIDPNFINYSGQGSLGTLVHVLLHPDGERVLVTSQTQNVVHSFGPEGDYLGVFAPAGGANTAIMQNIRGMAFHPDTGNLLITSASGGNNNTVVEFDLEGNFQGVFIASGSGGISGPWSIQFRAADVLVAASGGNIYRYQRSDGAFLEVWNNQINFPEQILELEGGNVLAAAFSAPSGVWELDSGGNQLAIYNPVTGLRGVYELPGGNILTTNSGGVHEISRANALVGTKITGSSHMISFVQSINCSIPAWLGVAPISGAVDPGGTDTLAVSFDATGLAPGGYTAGICIESNDPLHPVVAVPVELTVVLPADVATIEGTVQGLGYCSAEPAALEGATVEIAGAVGTYVLETDENGFYQVFLPESESPIDITVTAPGHLPASAEGIGFAGHDLVVRNFALTLDAPCATAEPDSFEFELQPDRSASGSLLIGNADGGAQLDWQIVTAGLPGAGASSVASSTASGAGAGAMGAVAAGAAGAEEAMDLATVLGESLPGLRVISPLSGVVDCDAAPGILVHDDGTVENAYSGNPDVVGQVIFVDRFTPSSYPAGFTAVCVAIVSAAGGPSSYDLEIVAFADDGPGGVPGTLLGALPVTVTDLPVWPITQPTWASFDISSLGIAISSGSVYLGARWAPTSPNVFLAADQTIGRPVGFAGGFWWNDSSQAWTPIQSSFASYRALFVRAVEQLVDCDQPADFPWLSVVPAAGSTPAGQTSAVEVTVDSTGLAAGEYRAGLCLSSNDPVRSLITIPVTLVVDDSPIADLSPEAFAFSVPERELDAGVLSVGNLGATDLEWSIATDELEGLLGPLAHDPALDEAFAVADFQVVPLPQGGGPVVFTVPAGALTRGLVVGFSFVGTASGISGAATWASDTCMVVTAPDGTTFGVGGTGAPVMPGCGVQNAWNFQGSGSSPDGTYASLHDGVFAELEDQGDWTITFVHDWNSTLAVPITWSDVTVTLHKVPLPICADPTEAPWLSVDPESGVTPPAGAVPVEVAVDASELVEGDEREAFLCVATNDPRRPLVIVPVELTVLAPLTPAEQVQLLIDQVEALHAAGTINHGQKNALLQPLERALAALLDGDTAAAVRQLRRFVSQVESLLAEGVLSEDEAAPLIARANRIIEELEQMN